MNENKTNRSIALAVTLIAHLLLALLLWMIHLHRDLPAEEDGVLVLVGDVEEAMGNDRIDATGETDIDGAAEPQTVEAEAAPAVATTPDPTPVHDEPLIAQNEDPAPAIAAQEKRKREEEARRAEERRKAEQQAKADAEAKKRAEAEAVAKAQAEAKAKAEAEAKRKAEEEARKSEEARKAEEARQAAVRSRLGNLTGGNSGSATQGQGAQGGNVGGNTGATQGQSTGSGTQGTHGGSGISVSGLNGRGVQGGLKRPAFNANVSGTVVVTITVDPSGAVTSASVRPTGTTTSNTQLRNAAVAAAKQTRFQPMAGQTSQGTITYTFDSDN